MANGEVCGQVEHSEQLLAAVRRIDPRYDRRLDCESGTRHHSLQRADAGIDAPGLVRRKRGVRRAGLDRQTAKRAATA